MSSTPSSSLDTRNRRALVSKQQPQPQPQPHHTTKHNENDNKTEDLDVKSLKLEYIIPPRNDDHDATGNEVYVASLHPRPAVVANYDLFIEGWKPAPPSTPLRDVTRIQPDLGVGLIPITLEDYDQKMEQEAKMDQQKHGITKQQQQVQRTKA